MVVRLVALLLAALVAQSGAARAETGKVRLAVQFGLIYLPAIIAHEEGFIAREAKAAGLPDLEVTMVRLSGSTAIMDSILSGNVDLGAFGTPGLLIAWEKTRGAQRILGLAAMGAHRHQLFTAKPQLRKLEDFTDADKIAVPAFSSPQAILLRIAAEQLLGSAKRADALLVSMPHPEALAAVQSGTLSGYISSPPFSQILERDPRIHSVLKSTTFFGGADASAVIFGGTQGFMDENPRVSLAVLRAFDQAGKLIRDDPRRAAEIYLRAERVKISPDDVVRILTDGSITYDCAPHGFIRYATFMRKLGMMKTVPTTWQEAFSPLTKDRAGD